MCQAASAYSYTSTLCFQLRPTGAGGSRMGAVGGAGARGVAREARTSVYLHRAHRLCSAAVRAQNITARIVLVLLYKTHGINN